MPTESKKLLSSDVAGYSDAMALSAFQHDARIAHEQREVIRRLVTECKGSLTDLRIAATVCRTNNFLATADCLDDIADQLSKCSTTASPYLED